MSTILSIGVPSELLVCLLCSCSRRKGYSLMAAFTKGWLILLTSIALALAGCNAEPTATPVIQAITPALTKSVTPPATSPLVVEKDKRQWLVYQGPNSYRGDLLFEVRYDSTQWRYSDGDPFGPVLIHLKIPSCFFVLSNAGNPYSDAIGMVQLASRDWSIFKTSDASLLYQSPPFGFAVFVLDNPATETRDACHQAAKEVLDSFKPLTN